MINRRNFFLNIILPTLLAIGLFIVLIFRFIIPYFEQNMLNGKKEMIRELVQASISIVSRHERDAAAGRISADEARKKAVAALRHLRYGIDNKDYCWITDRQPRMIMHPYRPDLNGRDLSDFKDPEGKKLFVEMVQAVERGGEGYVDYIWQWMDDSARLVPKISYVKEFRPWGWIIGTGVYIEDVRRETAAIRGRLTLVSLVISILMGLLLTFIARQNLFVEKRRSRAESELKESREKYKALVEASTEGTWMVLEGKTIYANPRAREILSGSVLERISEDLHEIVDPGRGRDRQRLADFFREDGNYLQLETRILMASGSSAAVILSLSKVMLAGKRGVIAMVRELTPAEKEEGEGAGSVGELARSAELLGAGFFRVAPGRKGRIIDINGRGVALLGYSSRRQVLDLDLLDFIADREEWKGLVLRLGRQGLVREYPLHVRTRERGIRVFSLCAQVDRDGSGRVTGTTGIFADITEFRERQEWRDDALLEMQSTLSFLNQALGTLAVEPLYCGIHAAIREAAVLMTGHDRDELLLRTPAGEVVGIVTDHDIRRRAVAAGLDSSRPVLEVMSSPVIGVDESTPVAEAILLMRREGIGRLAVRKGDRIAGMFRRDDSDMMLQGSEKMLLSRIRNAATLEDIRSVFPRLPVFVGALVTGGARTGLITRLISSVTDGISRKLIALTVTELGAPPVPFAFIALGSEGRAEQTLLTDQDNALIYRDVDGPQAVMVQDYFLRFASRMNELLARSGFALCKGGIMAGNPRWNQSLSVWKQYFSQWIAEPEPQNLLDITTFFDLRAVHGDLSLAQDLNGHIAVALKAHPAFFAHLARVCMGYKTPLGLFGKIHTESGAGHENSVNIKNATRVIVNLVRLYAMVHEIGETNTIQRMRRLYEREVFSAPFLHDLLYAFDFLHVLQFRSQAKAFRENRDMDHFVELRDLSAIEIDTLKSIFSQIGLFQSKLKQDFAIKE